ncbi:MAG: DNA polymerase III subunit gamma/tau [Kiritimatiellae bacterium]|nr:DNA polymerase III subunit gamma/tau [Kiritimatiellia bacterium]
MAYEVLARKWRPRQFDDVVGQHHVTRTLVNAITTGRIAHAYLFVGPRGIGKTSIARIFARALNCAQGPTPRPCDRCPSCTDIAAGASLDVIEIDGASNNSVDQVRELRDTARFAPARDRFKIYIIDEVHMLTIGAFNALLKTLEEPPAHVKFFFATTEAHKVPATILSRCQRFDLRRISTADIAAQLGRIAEAEGIQIDAEARRAIARLADGALRDAESALDQLVAFCGRNITEEDVLSVFGLTSRHHLEHIADAVIRGDAAGLLAAVAQLDAAGRNLARLPLELVEHFRNVLSAAATGEAVDAPPDEAEIWRRQAAAAGVERLLRIVEVLVESEARVRQSLSPRTALEITLLRCARIASGPTLEAVLQRLDECVAMLSGTTEPSAGESGASTAAASTPATSRVTEAPPEGRPGDAWAAAVSALGDADPSLRPLLRDSVLQPLPPGRARILLHGTPASADHLQPRQRRMIAKAVARVLGREAEIEFAAASPGDPLPPTTARPAAETPLLPAEVEARRAAREQRMNEGRVTAFLERFNGRIEEVED